jgi:hypothetical protein
MAINNGSRGNVYYLALSPIAPFSDDSQRREDHPTTLKGRVVIRHMDIAKGDDV